MAWREPLLRAGQIILIVLLAWVVQRILTRGITRLGNRYPQLPAELLMPLRGV
ncbi:MAG: mechanosensitive ion channel family protein, partial [Pseudomonas sp.]|nr:mechanosensitive ion channel family protein [Pseudomonas sp.]